MRRRDLLKLSAFAPALWPLAVHADLAPRRIGVVSGATAKLFEPRLDGFRSGLLGAGFMEGRDFFLDCVWANDRNEELPKLVSELVDRNVSVLAALGSLPAALAAKSATTRIPVVFLIGGDPIETGLVNNLQRPGANITGVTALNVEQGPKRLEIVRMLLPAARKIAVLVNETNASTDLQMAALLTAAQSLKVELFRVQAATADKLSSSLKDAREAACDALIVGTDSLFATHIGNIASAANEIGLPAVSGYKEFAERGGLISYGGDFLESYRTAGVYTARIVRGERAGDLPVYQVVKVELTINMKTASLLRVEVPATLQVRADRVIE